MNVLTIVFFGTLKIGSGKTKYLDWCMFIKEKNIGKSFFFIKKNNNN